MSKSISFFRHGRTDEAKTDAERNLSQEGMQQAEEKGKKLNISYDIAYHSPYKRTKQTLELLARSNKGPAHILPELIYKSGSPEGDLMEKAFRDINYSPISDYRTKCDEETFKILVEFGETAWAALVKDLTLPANRKKKEIIVVGHAILTPFIILAAYPKAKGDELAKVEALNFDFCEGARLTFNDEGECTGIEIINN